MRTDAKEGERTDSSRASKRCGSKREHSDPPAGDRMKRIGRRAAAPDFFCAVFACVKDRAHSCSIHAACGGRRAYEAEIIRRGFRAGSGASITRGATGGLNGPTRNVTAMESRPRLERDDLSGDRALGQAALGKLIAVATEQVALASLQRLNLSVVAVERFRQFADVGVGDAHAAAPERCARKVDTGTDFQSCGDTV